MPKTLSLIFFVSLNFNAFAQERITPSFSERFESLNITSQYFRANVHHLYASCVATITNNFYSCEDLSVEFISQNSEFSELIMNTCTLPMLNSTFRRGVPLEELNVAPLDRAIFHREVLSINRDTVSTTLTSKLQNQCSRTGYVEIIGIDNRMSNRDASYRMKVISLPSDSVAAPATTSTNQSERAISK